MQCDEPAGGVAEHHRVGDAEPVADGFTGEIAQHFFGTLAPGYDLRPRLARIGVPTLVAVGRYDWVCPPIASRILAAGIPDAELVEFAESGHFPYAEEPAAFQTTVGAFLSRIGPLPSTG